MYEYKISQRYAGVNCASTPAKKLSVAVKRASRRSRTRKVR